MALVALRTAESRVRVCDMRPGGVSAVTAGQAPASVSAAFRDLHEFVEGHALRLRKAHAAFDLADRPPGQRRSEVLADAHPGFIGPAAAAFRALRSAVAVP